MNYFTAFTAALVTGAGAAFQSGALPAKYAGYAMIAATMLQAFQGAIHKPTPSGTKL